MPANKRQPMTIINEERFRKAEEILRATQSHFISQELDTSFTAFVDMKTWRAIEGHIQKCGYGNITSGGDIAFIQYGDWKIYWLPQKIDEGEKIGILMFPGNGIYRSPE